MDFLVFAHCLANNDHAQAGPSGGVYVFDAMISQISFLLSLHGCGDTSFYFVSRTTRHLLHEDVHHRHNESRFFLLGRLKNGEAAQRTATAR